jgi:hypothetical protein
MTVAKTEIRAVRTVGKQLQVEMVLHCWTHIAMEETYNGYHSMPFVLKCQPNAAFLVFLQCTDQQAMCLCFSKNEHI